MQIGGGSSLLAMMQLMQRPVTVPDRPAGSGINDLLASLSGDSPVSAISSIAGGADGKGGSAMDALLGDSPVMGRDSLKLSSGVRSGLSLADFA